MAEIKTLLDDVIETEISNLKTLPVEDEEAVRAAQSLRFIRGLFRALYGEHPIFFEEVFSNEDERRKIKSHVDN